MTATTPPTVPRTTAGQSGRRPVDRLDLPTRLLGSAAKKSYDPVVDIDWDAAIPDGLYGPSRRGSAGSSAPMIATVSAIAVENLVQPGVDAAAGPDRGGTVRRARANDHYREELRGAATGTVSFLRGGPPHRRPARAALEARRLV